jgi:hypothetical protein
MRAVGTLATEMAKLIRSVTCEVCCFDRRSGYDRGGVADPARHHLDGVGETLGRVADAQAGRRPPICNKDGAGHIGMARCIDSTPSCRCDEWERSHA